MTGPRYHTTIGEPRGNGKPKTTTVRISIQLHKQIRKLADQEGRRIERVVENLLLQALKPAEGKP